MCPGQHAALTPRSATQQAPHRPGAPTMLEVGRMWGGGDNQQRWISIRNWVQHASTTNETYLCRNLGFKSYHSCTHRDGLGRATLNASTSAPTLPCERRAMPPRPRFPDSSQFAQVTSTGRRTISTRIASQGRAASRSAFPAMAARFSARLHRAGVASPFAGMAPDGFVSADAEPRHAAQHCGRQRRSASRLVGDACEWVALGWT